MQGTAVTRPPDHVDTSRLETAPRLWPLTSGPGSGRARDPRRPGTRRGTQGQRLAAAVLAVQVVAILGATGIQPETADATVAWAWLGNLLVVLLFGALTLAAVQVGRPRHSLNAGVGAGMIGMALIVGCPVTGHHGMGAWWFGAFALGAVMIVAPVLARRRLGDADRVPGPEVPPTPDQ